MRFPMVTIDGEAHSHVYFHEICSHVGSDSSNPLLGLDGRHDLVEKHMKHIQTTIVMAFRWNWSN